MSAIIAGMTTDVACLFRATARRLPRRHATVKLHHLPRRQLRCELAADDANVSCHSTSSEEGLRQ
jgi:hypothetical protein